MASSLREWRGGRQRRSAGGAVEKVPGCAAAGGCARRYLVCGRGARWSCVRSLRGDEAGGREAGRGESRPSPPSPPSELRQTTEDGSLPLAPCSAPAGPALCSAERACRTARPVSIARQATSCSRRPVSLPARVAHIPLGNGISSVLARVLSGCARLALLRDGRGAAAVGKRLAGSHRAEIENIVGRAFERETRGSAEGAAGRPSLSREELERAGARAAAQRRPRSSETGERTRSATPARSPRPPPRSARPAVHWAAQVHNRRHAPPLAPASTRTTSSARSSSPSFPHSTSSECAPALAHRQALPAPATSPRAVYARAPATARARSRRRRRRPGPSAALDRPVHLERVERVVQWRSIVSGHQLRLARQPVNACRHDGRLLDLDVLRLIAPRIRALRRARHSPSPSIPSRQRPLVPSSVRRGPPHLPDLPPLAPHRPRVRPGQRPLPPRQPRRLARRTGHVRADRGGQARRDGRHRRVRVAHRRPPPGRRGRARRTRTGDEQRRRCGARERGQLALPAVARDERRRGLLIADAVGRSVAQGHAAAARRARRVGRRRAPQLRGADPRAQGAPRRGTPARAAHARQRGPVRPFPASPSSLSRAGRADSE